MKFICRPVIVRFGLAILAALMLAAGAAHAQVAAPAPVLRDVLVVPLREAQEHLAGGRFAEALARLAATDAVSDRTPVELYYVERLRAAAASGVRDTQQAAKSLEIVLATGLAPISDRPELIGALAGAHYNLKQYRRAAQWAGSYFAQGGTKPEMRLMAAQAAYLGGDFAGAVAALRTLQREQEAAGVTAPESQLDMLAGSYIKLQDDAGYMSVLEQLVRSYPRPEYWADLLVRLERRPGFSPVLVIDLFRLQYAAGALIEANEYLELAQLAAQAGFAEEAKKVVDAGFAARVLGIGPDAPRHERFREQVGERAAAEAKSLETPAMQPAAAQDGEALFRQGQIRVSHGQSAQGLALMQQALDRGGLVQPGPARLRLAAAHAQAGDKARARELLQALQDGGGTDGLADLARLWTTLVAR